MTDNLPPAGTLGEVRGWLHGPLMKTISAPSYRGNAIMLMGTVHNCDWTIDHYKAIRGALPHEAEKLRALYSAVIKTLELERDKAADEACSQWLLYKEAISDQTRGPR